jgi:hypothetical protein
MSAVKKFKRCPRSFWLSYGTGTGDGVEPERDPEKPLTGQRDVGTLAHLGVASIYRGEDWRATLADEKRRHEGEGVLSPEWEKVYFLVDRMVEGFEEWRDETGADAQEEVLHVEERYKRLAGTFHGDEVWITAGPDLIVRNRVSGLITVDDWKTVASLDPPATLAFDDQKLTYGWVLDHVLGEKVHTFRHTQLKKVQRTAKAKPPFYARHEVTYSEDQRALHERHLYGTISRMVASVQAVEADPDAHHDWLYPTPNRDCSWDCDFIHLCPMMDQGDDWQAAKAVWFTTREDPTTP